MTDNSNDQPYNPHNPLLNRLYSKKPKTYCCKSKLDNGFLGDNKIIGEDCTPSNTIMCNPWNQKFRCNNDNPKTLQKNSKGVGFITTIDRDNGDSNCNFVPGIATRVLKDGLARVAMPSNEFKSGLQYSEPEYNTDLKKIMEGDYTDTSKSGGKKHKNKKNKKTKRTKKNKKTHKKK